MDTLQWKVEDNYEKVHTWTIKDPLYLPDISTCLLSPQHWAKQAEDNFPRRRVTWCATYDDACEIEWDQRKYRRTIPLDSKSNTPRLMSAPNCVNYRRKARLLEKVANTCELEQTMAFCTTIKQAPNKIKNNEQDENIVDPLHDLPVNTNLYLVNEDASTSAITDQDELLRRHFRLGHLSFRKK